MSLPGTWQTFLFFTPIISGGFRKRLSLGYWCEQQHIAPAISVARVSFIRLHIQLVLQLIVFFIVHSILSCEISSCYLSANYFSYCLAKFVWLSFQLMKSLLLPVEITIQLSVYYFQYTVLIVSDNLMLLLPAVTAFNAITFIYGID